MTHDDGIEATLKRLRLRGRFSANGWVTIITISMWSWAAFGYRTDLKRLKQRAPYPTCRIIIWTWKREL